MAATEVTVPDIGDFTDVPIIEIHVAVGDEVAPEDPLVTLESDKATMDIPSPMAGTVTDLRVALEDKVSEGTLLLVLDAVDGAVPTAEPEGTELTSEPAAAAAPPASSFDGDVHDTTQVVVIGSGPGGYTAAFRAADLGLKTTLVERYASLGGVCLNVGCIPSKALLHAAKVIGEAADMAEHGITFGEPQIDLPVLGSWKASVVDRLTGGLAGLAKQRDVTVVQGTAEFASDHVLKIATADGKRTLGFDHAIIAVGSSSVRLPFLPEDPRIMDSTGALELPDVPERLLVIGGGIIGLEMATVYESLGSKVTVVELLDGLMPGADRDLVRPLQRRIEKRYEAIHVGTRVTAVEAGDDGLKVTFEGGKAPEPEVFDRILLAVGRTPNGKLIGADKAGVAVDERGFIAVDEQLRTNVPHIHAIGDVIGEPMLAHKATHEGTVAAEVIAGENVAFEPRGIPSVAYTDPEVAWIGLTETQAKEEGIAFEKGTFPWAASGRALGLGRDEGLTKLLVDPETRQVLGAGIVGPSAGDLVAEVALALELGADAEDIGLTIHPHPTLSETVAFSAEAVEGTITDLYVPKRKAPR
jgi:dihydrolipoamide dehydrogenase